MSEYDYVITNQSNLSSPYYLQDNGQVSINALTTLLFHFCIYNRSYVSMILKDMTWLMVLATNVMLQMSLDQNQDLLML